MHQRERAERVARRREVAACHQCATKVDLSCLHPRVLDCYRHGHAGNELQLPYQRTALIAGLRDLAEFLDQNRQVPAPWHAEVLVFPDDGSDAEMFAEVDAIAEQIGTTASDADSPTGHYRAARNFGPVQYRVVAIPHHARHDENEGAE